MTRFISTPNRRVIAAIVVCSGIALAASNLFADGIWNPIASNKIGSPQGPRNPTSGGGGAGCNGVIDLSTGCAMPMLGGL
jgi:hypothetical protein